MVAVQTESLALRILHSLIALGAAMGIGVISQEYVHLFFFCFLPPAGGRVLPLDQTVALPSSEIPDAHQKIWDAVHLAQQTAITTARSNITARDVDKAARRTLLSLGGLDKYFTHRLGHGEFLSPLSMKI